jgi:hypothetical protein
MQKKDHIDLAEGYTLRRWFSELREDQKKRKNPKVAYVRLNLFIAGLYLILMIAIPFGLLENLESYRAQRLILSACLMLFLGLSLGTRAMAEKEKIRYFLKNPNKTKA